jgi:uncharacterized protein YbjT (DUF2867 family)
MRTLIVGATGSIGRRLAETLIDRGETVACMVRSPDGVAASAVRDLGCELRPADLDSEESLEDATHEVDVVYHLAHLMSAEGDDLVADEAGAATRLARAARRNAVQRLIYLGGLGDASASTHLSARHRTAQALSKHGPPLTYFRAAMVVGADSESFVLLRSIVERLPALPVPDWLENRTQPIGVDAVVEYLADALRLDAAEGREIQIGGPETMTYREMLDGMADALGKDPPNEVPAPAGFPAKAAGRAAGAVTRGDAKIAEHLTAGLATDTLVGDPSGMALFDIQPEDYRLALARAIEDAAVSGVERDP